MPMGYSEVFPQLLIGSCPRNGEDIDQLKTGAGVTAVLNLQTDEDLKGLGVDWPALRAHYRTTGIELVRVPMRDFDSDDLRERLPECVRTLDALLAAGHTVYLHCTAGVNRSPTAAIAYLHWCRGWELDQAVEHVKRCRDCSPDVDAIRDAKWEEKVRDRSEEDPQRSR